MSKDPLFDSAHFDRVGAAFDKFLPYLEPVGAAILARLPALQDGADVVDLACGTGEPGLTLARSQPQIRLLGVDGAENMLAVARRKAEAIPNARFEAMPLDALTLRSKSVDAAVSRFGLLMFGDAPASAAELGRVLKPGGLFSFAAWQERASNTFLDVCVRALGSQLDAEQMPPFDQFDALAVAGHRERLLSEAGIQHVESELFRWNYDFADLEIAWDAFTGPGMFSTLIAPLTDTQRSDMRRRFTELLAPYRDAMGAYSLPQTCRLFWGRR